MSSFLLPTTYTIKESEEIFSVKEAAKTLSDPFESLSVTRVSLLDEVSDKVLITRYSLICPLCNKSIPAYTYAFDWSSYFTDESKVEANLLLWKWKNRGTKELDVDDKRIEFDRALDKEHVTCPYCRKIIFKDGALRETEVSFDKEKVYLSIKLLDSIEYNVPWLEGLDHMELSLPIYETLIFNPKKHCVCVVLGDKRADNPQYSMDITNNPFVFKNDDVLTSVFSHSEVSAELSWAFKSQFGVSVPFPVSQLTVKDLILCTKFSNFDKSFYDAVPFRVPSNEIDPGFETINKMLCDYESALKKVEEYVPKYKSVRRLLLENQSKLFYLPEIKTICEILKNPNLIKKMLCKKSVNSVLAWLHFQPEAVRFITDMCSVNKSLFVNVISNNPIDGIRYASTYCLMSEAQKEKEQRTWLQREFVPVDLLDMLSVFKQETDRNDAELFLPF